MMRRLADIADIRAGFPFRGRVEPVPDGTLAVVQMKDVDDSAGLNPAGCLRIVDEPSRYDRHLLEVGDVLLQSRGHKFPAVVFDKPLHGVAALGLMVIRPSGAAIPEYLNWLLNNPRTREAMRAVARGTYVPFLSRANLEELQVLVPALDIQRRIVVIDQLRRQEQKLTTRLSDLNNKFTDALVWKAAASNKRT
jgi:hypothetical protein